MAETILVAEDNAVERRLLTNLLTKRFGYTVLTAQDGEDAVKQIQSSNVGDISAVLLDIQMPNIDGFEALKVIRKYRPDLPVLMLTGSDDTTTAVKAIKEGAGDFIVKPAEPIHLNKTIKNAIRLSMLSREMAKMKRNKGVAPAFTDLIGHNAGLKNAIAYSRKASVSDVPVLITGETGVGKELFARIIHNESKRVSAPFIAINCNAIQEHMVDDILFSHDKGAFRKAESGTIFLDDIGALPQEAQVRLLRVLQHREIEPSSGSRAIKVNVRVISAAEGDIVRDVQSGRFREDLYFQLNIMPIRIPALRERQDDIVPLAEFFIERLSILEGLLSKTLDKSAKQYLVQQLWPGNVRELENLIHRTLVLSDSDVIDDDTLMQIHETGAIPVLQVQDILGPQRITPVPLAPPEISGSLNLRGRIVTAIDVRIRLGLPPRPIEMKGMSIVVNHNEELYSLIVDKVGEVMSLQSADYEKNPATLDPRWQEISNGLYRLKSGLLIVLDVSRLLRLEQNIAA